MKAKPLDIQVLTPMRKGLLGNGQRKNAHHDEKLFSSVFEALVAGIYLDGGMEAAKRFVKNTVITDFEKTERFKDKRSVAKDYKSEFQEFVQKRTRQRFLRNAF